MDARIRGMTTGDFDEVIAFWSGIDAACASCSRSCDGGGVRGACDHFSGRFSPGDGVGGSTFFPAGTTSGVPSTSMKRCTFV